MDIYTLLVPFVVPTEELVVENIKAKALIWRDIHNAEPNVCLMHPDLKTKMSGRNSLSGMVLITDENVASDTVIIGKRTVNTNPAPTLPELLKLMSLYSPL